MGQTRTIATYNESIHEYVEENKKKAAEKKKQDLEDAKYWHRKTNSTWIASLLTDIPEDEILGKKKPEVVKKEEPKVTKKKLAPVQENKHIEDDEILDESRLDRESRRLTRVDYDYEHTWKKKLGTTTREEYRRSKGFSKTLIEQIMIYRKKQNPSFWDAPLSYCATQIKEIAKHKPTPEERLKILKDQKKHRNDLREKYDIPKKPKH